MCIFCGGTCGGIGDVLAPVIGVTLAMYINRIEWKIKAKVHRIKKYFKSKKYFKIFSLQKPR
jgi:hypothetical protein